jgi:hypothetical protein
MHKPRQISSYKQPVPKHRLSMFHIPLYTSVLHRATYVSLCSSSIWSTRYQELTIYENILYKIIWYTCSLMLIPQGSKHARVFSGFKNNFSFFQGTTAPSGPGPPHYRGFMTTLSDTPHSVRLLWTSDQPDAQTSTWQHTTLTRDRHQCPRRDSNPPSQQTKGCRPTP